MFICMYVYIYIYIYYMGSSIMPYDVAAHHARHTMSRCSIA